MEKRKVKISKFQDGSGGFDKPGVFHEWGNKEFPTDDGMYFPVKKGIIEFEDGHTEMIDVHRIKFEK